MNKVFLMGTVNSPPKGDTKVKKSSYVDFTISLDGLVCVKVSCTGELAQAVDRKLSLGSKIFVEGESVSTENDSEGVDGHIKATTIHLMKGYEVLK